MANDEPFFGKMNWTHTERNVNISPNMPVSIDLQNDLKELKISSTVSRILGLDITSSFFYRCMSRHLFSTIFVSGKYRIDIEMARIYKSSLKHFELPYH